MVIEIDAVTDILPLEEIVSTFIKLCLQNQLPDEKQYLNLISNLRAQVSKNLVAELELSLDRFDFEKALSVLEKIAVSK